MLILDANNKPRDVDQIGQDEEVFYGILDFSKPKSPDYVWKEVIFIDTYYDACAVLEVGEKFQIALPFRWSIVAVFLDSCETVPIEKIVSHPYDAFVLNPIDGYMPEKRSVRVTECRKDGALTSPSLQKNQLLVVPVGFDNPDKGPLCIIAGEGRAKVPEILDISTLW